MWGVSSNKIVRIGFRGYGNHAKKIEKILILKEFQVYKISRNFLAEEILPNTQAIFVTAPNNTHLNYIEKALRVNPKLPVYCEKPLINNKDDYLKITKLLDSGKIFPGFNLRRSLITEIIHNNVYKNKFGQIKSFKVDHSYPFGLKDSFKESWKSKKEFSPLEVLENLSIHFIDLAFFLFGEKEKSFIQISDYCNLVPRTCDVIINHKSGIISSIHNSYSEAFSTKLTLDFEYGKIIFSENQIDFFYPNLNIDQKSNLCINSPLVKRINKKFSDLFSDSLESSINLFLKNLNKPELFNIDDSIKTTKLTLNMISTFSDECN